MADGGDTLGSLPPPRVKFKEKMEDIREATIEGSQFEAQFPEERTPLPVPIKSPRPQTPRNAQTSDIANRPKTTLRRSTSEKSVPEIAEEDQQNLSLSRKSTHESMSRKNAQNAHESPSISRRSTQEQLGRKSSQDGVGGSKPGTANQPFTRSGSTNHSKLNTTGSARRGNESQNGYTSDANVLSDRSEPTSRLSSQLSFNHSRSDSISKNRSGNRQESGYKLTSRNSASEIVQKKGKIMENGW